MGQMKKIIAALISLSMLLSGVPTVSFAEDVASVQTVEYIIRYNSDELLSNGTISGSETDSSSIEETLENHLTGATNIQIIDEIESVEGHTTKLFSINTANEDELSSELNSIDGIYFAEPNYKIRSFDTDSGLNQQWAINGTNTYGIETEKAWELSQGQDVLVAVIDTGVDISHRDLEQNIYTNPNETVNGLDSDNNGYKDDLHGWNFTTYQNSVNNGDNSVYDNAESDKHGTHIAGIIAAASNNYDGKGVAPQAKILPVKILSDNEGTVFTAIKGIEYAEMMGAKIANCSWGSEHYSQFLYDTIAKSDMLFVCAAGNDGYDTEKTPTYPAAYDLDNIISVAATDNQGQLASFSNYGKSVDIAAPGKDIYSTLPDNGFGALDGTSMAAPFVSGCAALLLGVSENITAKEIKDRILLTANRQTSLDGKVETGGIVSATGIMMTTVSPGNFTVGRSGQRIVEANNEIYSIGGYDGNSHIGKIDKYDPINKVWQTIGNMPVAVSDCAVGVCNKKIFVVGGMSENPVDNVQVYDLSTNTWSNGNSMPEQLFGGAYAQKDNSLYIFGGTGITGIRNCVYKYNMETNTWERKTDLPCKMTYSTAVLSDGSIYLIGGNSEDEVLNCVYMYDDTDDTVEYVSHMQVGRKNCAVAAMGNKIYIFGGSISLNKHGKNVLYEMNKAKGAYIEAVTDTVEVLNIDTGICSEAEPLQNAIRDYAALNYFDNIYLFGGWDGEHLNITEKYFGAAIPKNIRIKTAGNKLNIKWNSISEADKYKIEIDGNVYETVENSYQVSANDNVEHKIRIKALQGNKQSMWSDYIFHYSNSTLLDAKTISVNSQTSDKLYETGQTRWYKLDNSQAGNLTVTLGNVPQNSNYIVQLCSISGEIIATGNTQDNIQRIENIVLSPYPYYIKVTSVYGGSETDAYTLDCSFVASSEEDVPDRVKSAFLKPSALDNLSLEMKPMSEYDGDETPSKTSDENITKLIPTEVDGGHGTNAYIEEDVVDEGDSDNETSLMSLNNYSEETGTLSAKGKTADGSITVSRNTAASSQKCKVVIEVIPENAYDEMKIEWIGSNTDYENFWWLSHEDGVNHVYYLTALLSSNTGGTYRYRITCDYLGYSSNGKYTVKKYIICDSYQNEDYDNRYCGNEVPLYASNANPSSNSSVSKTGKIDHPYDRDYYYVTASANEKVTAYLKAPDGKKYDVSIYDNRCTTNNQYASEYMDGWISENTAYATISGKSSSTVKYCIRVGSNDGSYSYDETYTLYVYKYNISQLGDLEVNNSFENADGLKTNVLSYLGSETKSAKQIKFSIDSPVDRDCYAIDMSAGEKLSVKMDLPANYTDSVERYRIEIYSDVVKGDTETNYKARSFNNPGAEYSKYVTFIPEKSGTYYVAVRSLEQKYNYSKYGTLIITKTSASSLDSYEAKAYECTNDFARTTVLSLFGREFYVDGCALLQNSLTANFDNELDVDWYKFVNASETKTAVIKITGTNITNAVDIIVLDSNFEILSTGVSGKTYTFVPNETYYIAAYVKDNKYPSIMNNRTYSIAVELSDLRSELRFTPLEWGTFVYDNDPEFLTDDDMADYNLGNRLLMSADGLTGVVDFQSSHSAKPYMLDGKQIGFDVLLYNPTDKVVTVDVDRIGYQLPYENSLNGATDWTTTNWVCLRAWADFMQMNISNDMLIGREKENYKDYNFKYVHNQLPNGGHYEIQPGKAVWMLGEARPVMTKRIWSPFNLVSRIRISDGGTINLGFAAFRNINNVYSPQNAKLIYDVETQRTYPANFPYSEKELDVNGKPKGVASSAAETNAYTKWIISDDTTYFRPTVYNYANENGFVLGGGQDDYWVTNFNPNADTWGFNCGVESDILRMDFYDEERPQENNVPWIFDTRHTNPLSGNGDISGEAPVENAMPLGNYGVVERYTIDITNTTNNYKTISYIMNTASHAIISYKDGDAWWERKIKLGEIQRSDETYEQFQTVKKREIFNIGVGAGETKQLIIEVILPNADAGGLQHQLKVN